MTLEKALFYNSLKLIQYRELYDLFSDPEAEIIIEGEFTEVEVLESTLIAMSEIRENIYKLIEASEVRDLVFQDV